MLRIIDRYILREIIPPFCLAVFVLTFLLMIPPVMGVAEDLISKGVDAFTILQLMGTLIPQGLGITIPIGLLLGALMGLGRLSSDREMVAFQACGISLFRMLAPLTLLAAVSTLATGYVLITLLPNANQAFREITFRTVANRAEGEIKPRVFDEYFPGVVLYVREVSTTNEGWSEVLLADTRASAHPDIYVAESGRLILDREQRRVDIVLTQGTGHQVDPLQPETYEVHEFDEIVIGLDSDTVFPRTGPQRGYRELTISQLRNEADQMTAAGLSAHPPIMELHRKFAIPVACLVFMLIALGLGVTSRKDGKLASFALGTGVVFGYYVIMYGAEAMAKGALVSAQLAMWLPNLVLGLFGFSLVILRSRSVERQFLPLLFSRRAPVTSNEEAEGKERATVKPASFSSPHLGPLRLHILDWYVTRAYLGVAGLAFVGLLGIFYISTFIDLSDKLFKGETTGFRLLEYFWYATPQFSYYVLPIATLVATLVTVGLLTRNSELTVMKACGVSLYRAVLPIFLLSLLWSGLLFGMSESILAHANRQAEAINHEIRIGTLNTIDVMNRRWIVGRNGSIYHYLAFEPERDEFENLSVYNFGGEPWALQGRTFIEKANFETEEATWKGQGVWVRDFTSTTEDGNALATADAQPLPFLESPNYFETEPPDAELMNVRELDSYVDELSASGFDVVQLVVALHRKISFPFVTLIFTLIAIPFAVTMGPRGALYGVGVGISLACSYWIVMSVFGAIGTAGLLAPMLAAWAPNLLFGASATYLLLTVRT
jgi:LPS export ABC transporter permease LptF/LPS export ABC transporter permease LptG